MATTKRPARSARFPVRSNREALEVALDSAAHLTELHGAAIAFARTVADRVDELDANGFVIEGRFDNVSAGMFLKALDALGLTVQAPSTKTAAAPAEKKNDLADFKTKRGIA